MKEIAKLVIVLTVICALAGLLLAWVDEVTRAPIAAALRAEKTVALKKVLPDCDNTPDQDTQVVTADNSEWVFYVARKDGQYAGCAFETASDKGYGGNIVLMVGINADDSVRGIQVLKQKETPGLGAKITSRDFQAQFEDMPIDSNWSVAKDGGSVDEITAATISSRAVAEAIDRGLTVYTTNRETIRSRPANVDGDAAN